MIDRLFDSPRLSADDQHREAVRKSHLADLACRGGLFAFAAAAKTAPPPHAPGASDPVQSVAQPAGGTVDVVAAVKAALAPLNAAIAAINAPRITEKASPKVAAPVASAAPAKAEPVPGERDAGTAYLLPKTETQRRREAESRQETRRAAEKVAADRVLVSKGGARVMKLRSVNTSLSDAAVLALNHILQAWEAADRKPVKVSLGDVATTVGLSLEAARGAWSELVEARAIILHRDSLGVQRVQPGLGITGGR